MPVSPATIAAFSYRRLPADYGRILAASGLAAAADMSRTHDIVSVQPNGLPVTTPSIPIPDINLTVTVSPTITNNNNVHEVDITETGSGQPVGRLAVRPVEHVTESERAASDEDLRVLQSTPQGRSAVRATAEQLESETRRTQRTQSIQSGTDRQRQSARALVRGDRLQRPVAADAARVMSSSGRSDRARTSLEYHEWKHNCLDPGFNYDILQHSILVAATKDLTWDVSPTGDDPAGGEPPYWSWVKHDDFRAVINLVKRFRRYWRGKNMPLLRNELGFADVDEAIATSLSTDADYAAFRTALIATGDWA